MSQGVVWVGCLPKTAWPPTCPDLYRAVVELGQFFRELYSRNIRMDALESLRDKILTILCDLEKIYPPAFFDEMVHLAIHLPDEALLRGPI